MTTDENTIAKFGQETRQETKFMYKFTPRIATETLYCNQFASHARLTCKKLENKILNETDQPYLGNMYVSGITVIILVGLSLPLVSVECQCKYSYPGSCHSVVISLFWMAVDQPFN